MWQFWSIENVAIELISIQFWLTALHIYTVAGPCHHAVTHHLTHIKCCLDHVTSSQQKKRLTAALSHLNEGLAWRGAGLFPFNPQRALRTTVQEAPLEVERPKTPTQFHIFNQVFVNSSPPDASTLREVNELINSISDARTIPPTPVRLYIRKLAAGTEQLHARSIVHQQSGLGLNIDFESPYLVHTLLDQLSVCKARITTIRLDRSINSDFTQAIICGINISGTS
jgi:hypothetical protein